MIGLFSRAEIERWRGYLITLGEICKRANWNEKYSQELKSVLKLLEPNEFRQVLLYCHLPGTTTVDEILGQTKSAILLYCYWRFSDYYRTSLIKHLGIKELKGKKLRRSAFVGSLSLTDDELNGIMLHSIWRHAAIYERTYSYESLSVSDLPALDTKLKRIGVYLSRQRSIKSGPLERPYHYKLKGAYQNFLIYWILRQRSDQDEPSWPLNKRQKHFATKVIVLDLSNKQLRLVFHSKTERRIVIGFLQKNLKMVLTAEQPDILVKKNDLKAAISTESLASSFPITRVNFKMTNLAGHPRLTVRDGADKNSVANAIKMLEDSKQISVDDISVIESLNLLLDGTPVNVKVVASKAGYYKLVIPERNLTFAIRSDILSEFESASRLPINKFFTFEDVPVRSLEAINNILNSKMVCLSEEPPIYKSVLEDLYELGLLQKPEKESRRFCVNPKCNRAFVNTWAKGTCAECGNKMRIRGVYFSIKANKPKIREFLLSSLKNEQFSAVTGVRSINHKRTPVIEIYTPRGSVLVIPDYSTKINPALLDQVQYSDTSVVFAPYPFTSETETIRRRGHGIVAISELAWDYLSDSRTGRFSSEIDRCLDSFILRVMESGKNSLERIEAKKEYDFHKFEEDVFSLIHVILPTAQRLGDQFIGKKVPDGIASVPLTGKKRFCITWDCKYSDTEYNLVEKPSKTIHYLKKLPELSVVRNLGGLRSFVFVSNNMNGARFGRYVKKLLKKYTWRGGKIILLSSGQLISLYKHHISIRHNLLASPEASNKYYLRIADLFCRPRRRYYVISQEDISSIVNDSYQGKKLDIKRDEV